jgi:glycosyltransferase involved in cell wall biosynthesis
MYAWHIITCEYPPQPGGVSDYTRLVARGLAEAGDEVNVWAPQCGGSDPWESDIRVHRLPGHFGPRARAALDRALSGAGRKRVLVQYVPHGYGLKAMNVPFCYWLYSRRHWNIDVMFHEVAFRRRAAQPIRHNILGEVTSLMARLVARSARRIFVTSPAWERMLCRLAGNLGPIEWLPVPSNFGVVSDSTARAEIKAKYGGGGLLVGHFGTYGGLISKYLEMTIPQLLQKNVLGVLFLGRGAGAFRDALAKRNPGIAAALYAADGLPGHELSWHISACDLMFQPYPDGINTRRTSAMAALAHGRPVVTTSGRLTEPLWLESRAVATASADDPQALPPLVTSLLSNPQERQRLGLAGMRLYDERFDIRHTINGLRFADRHRQLVQP